MNFRYLAIVAAVGLTTLLTGCESYYSSLGHEDKITSLLWAIIFVLFFGLYSIVKSLAAISKQLQRLIELNSQKPH